MENIKGISFLDLKKEVKNISSEEVCQVERIDLSQAQTGQSKAPLPDLKERRQNINPIDVQGIKLLDLRPNKYIRTLKKDLH